MVANNLRGINEIQKAYNVKGSLIAKRENPSPVYHSEDKSS